MNTQHPLTPCQQLLWRSQSTSPSCPLFNQVVTVNLPPTSNPDSDSRVWAHAWQKVQLQHPVLTLRVEEDNDGHPHQWASKHCSTLDAVQLPVNPDLAQAAFCKWVCQRKQHALMMDAQMTDVAYLYTDDGQAMLYINVHHLIADAWSTVFVWQALEQYFLEEHKTEDVNGSEHLLQIDLSPRESVTSLNFFDYLSSTRWPTVEPLDRPTRQLAQQSETRDAGINIQAAEPAESLHQTYLSFYGHINNEPGTRSIRYEIPLSPTERQALLTLSIDGQSSTISTALHQMVLHLTVYAIYLHRVSRDKNIVIEIPLLGRFGKRWLNVAGNFIEIMQVTIAVDSDDSVGSVYQSAQDSLLAVLKLAAPGCTASLKAQTVHGVLNLITASVEHTRSSGTAPTGSLDWHHPEHSDMRHPLRLHVADWNNCGVPSIELDINHAYFAASQRERIPAHLSAVYRAVLSDHSASILSIPMMAPDECWSLTGPNVEETENQSSTLYQRVANTATHTPDAIALIELERQLSYRELIDQAQCVKEHLHAIGISQGDRVAVHITRCIDLPIVLLGVLASGAAYIPIDKSQPITRVNAILTDANIKVLIVDELQPDEPLSSAKTLVASELLKRINIAEASAAEVSLVGASTTKESVAELSATKVSASDLNVVESRSPSAGDTAYIMYTSGSTGTPKGVAVSHGALMSYLGWANDYYRLSTAINMPLFTSVGFDLTVTSLYLPWLSGGTLHVCPQSADTDALSLLSVIANKAINTVKLTPAHLSLLLESDTQFDSVAQFIVGGEDLKSSTAVAIQSRTENPLKIVNEYGPTEATVGCITHVWSPEDRTGSVPIGTPIRGMSAYLLNDAGLPEFEGVVGELYLEGRSLADGYWNDPEQSKEAFVTRPGVPGKRLYRTGDLARIENGKLVYLGRKDAQISFNGYRIELSEIESAVMEHPAISHCVVQFGREADLANKVHTSCTTCGLSSTYPGANIDDSGICSLCRSYLPNQERIHQYFRTPDELLQLIKEIKARRRGKYDAVVLLSGGKDSTYSLCKLVDLGLSVYAFSLDNGYISEQALANVDAVCEQLGVAHHYASTEHMEAIFNDSLTRYSNVCHGCFKTIYNLAMAFAAEHQIDTIFTGLSRGQLFETRFNNELFAEKTFPITQIDDMVVAARMQYHAIEDAPNTLLDINEVNNGTLPASIDIVDFYRYWHVEMADMLAYLESRLNWIRPPDTGRSTNCLINDVGIHVHQQEQGFHNYSLPYSWDVRLGHKERSEAMEELDDDIDTERVHKILTKIGYKPQRKLQDFQRIEAYFTTLYDLDPSALRHWLQDRLPGYMQPTRLHQVDHLPLNLHGKVDRDQVKTLGSSTGWRQNVTQLIPLNSTERLVAQHWASYVGANSISRDDNFFQLGGDSQAAIRCVMELRKSGYAIEPADLFKKPVLGKFAAHLDKASRIDTTAQTKTVGKFSHLSDAQREKLSKLLSQNTSVTTSHKS